MLRCFLLLSVGVVALLCLIGAPGRSYARHDRGGYQGGYFTRYHGGYTTRYYGGHYGGFGRRFQGGFRADSSPGFRGRSAGDYTVGPFGGWFSIR